MFTLLETVLIQPFQSYQPQPKQEGSPEWHKKTQVQRKDAVIEGCMSFFFILNRGGGADEGSTG
jgi:hypothetical protein